MKITPRRCLRNGVIILIIFGLLSCFKVLWRPKVTTVIRKPPSTLQWVQGQPTRKPATQIDYPTHTTEINDSSTSLLEKSRILILVYTKFWNEERWVGELRGECFLDYDRKTQCPLEKFEVTYDKKRFAESDLVIFHAAAINMPSLQHLRSLSKNRKSSQRWVYQSMESPMSTPDPEPLNGLFNLTWTYRGDADFSAAYAAYVPLSPEEKLNKMASFTTDFSQGKSELVAWLVSNCQSQLRMSFVRELKKYIKVDVFGSCSRLFGNPRKCSKSYEKHCLKRYKFYLSFENVMCKDYITEKYWDHLGKVCVVLLCRGRVTVYLTIIARVRMGSEPKAHEAEGRMGY